MKKFIVLGFGLCLAFGLTSCKSSESAYRKAYEKAKAQESTTAATTQPVEVAPVVTTPVVTAPVSAANDNVSVRSEKVTLVGAGNLQDYSVVVGSFGVEANARGLQQRLANRGYNSMVVSANTAKGLMYRVIASSFADKTQAVQSRSQLQSEFPDAWLLYRQ